MIYAECAFVFAVIFAGLTVAGLCAWKALEAPGQSEAETIAYARAHLTSPAAHALLDEVERGRQRRETREPGRHHKPGPPPGPAPRDVLHAHQITAADATLIRRMAGASFGPLAMITLPSGVTITGSEMQRWIETVADQPSGGNES